MSFSNSIAIGPEFFAKAKCANCGQKVSGYDDAIDCADCQNWFCDNCYDTSLGDGCGSHGCLCGQ